jgi:hypothetical protein
VGSGDGVDRQTEKKTHRVMRRPAGAQQPSVTLKKKIKFSGMGDVSVDDCSSGTIPTLVSISVCLREQPDGSEPCGNWEGKLLEIRT